MAASQARKSSTRTAKSIKDTQTRAKRLMREMLVFWKKNEREERDVRKRAEKEAVDRAKEEEEKREAARQARKLEFLISQTELYSHFVGNKLKSKSTCFLVPPASSEKRPAVEAEQVTDEGATGGPQVGPSHLPLGAEDGSTAPLHELDFDDGMFCLFTIVFSHPQSIPSEDQTNLHRHAARNAQDAILLARERAQAFDAQAAIDRKANEAHSRAKVGEQVRDEEVEGASATAGLASMSTPIVDCK